MGPESVSDLFAALYKRRLTILLVLAGAVGGAFAFLELIPVMYQATASVFVQANPTRLSLHSGVANIPGGPVVPDTRLETQLGLLGVASGGVVQARVAEILELDPKTLRTNIVLDTDRFKQLNILVFDRKRARAVAIANTTRDEVIKMLQQNVEMAPRANKALFDQELRLAQDKLRDSRNALVAYLDEIETPDLNVSVNRLFQDRARYLSQIENLDREERQSAAERPIIQQILESRPDWQEASRSIGRNSMYTTMVSRLADIDTELAITRLEVTDEHPSIQALLAQQSDLRTRLNEELIMVETGTALRVDDQAHALISQLIDFDVSDASLEARREVYQDLLELTELKLGEVPMNRMEVGRLEDEVQRSSRLVDDLRSRIYEIELQLRRGLDFTWTDDSRAATIEKTKQVPGRVGVFIFSGIAGLIMGVLMALGLELGHQMRRRRPF